MQGKRPAYVVSEVEITDPAVFQQYVAMAMPTLTASNGRIVAMNKAQAKEGTQPVGNIVIIAFDSVAYAERWYASAAYSDAIPLRQRSANTRLYIVEGEPQ